MTTQVAPTRQPFAPLSNTRLQNLTSLKNSQNAITSTLNSPSKRKAETFDFSSTEDFDSENIDPLQFLSPKRSKASDGASKDSFTFQKPANFFLTRTPITTPLPASPRRPILEARSPVKRLNTTVKASPLSAPAGRSPTRKRAGILNRRKTASPFTRIDPPKFSHAPSRLGFSIDAALSGTIPSYNARQSLSSKTITPVAAPTSLPIPELHVPAVRGSWFFDIHEDTPEEEATNLMEHSTCTLDISSDEESAARSRDERGKENVPPPDDVSQTRTVLSVGPSDVAVRDVSDVKARIRASRKKHEDAIEVDRSPLGDLAAEDFYAEGCDSSSIFVVIDDEAEVEASPETEAAVEPELLADEQQEVVEQDALNKEPFVIEQEIIEVPAFDIKGKGIELDAEVEALMARGEDIVAPGAALLEPIENAEDNFELWESGSAKDESEAVPVL